jgi:hypothetical protein
MPKRRATRQLFSEEGSDAHSIDLNSTEESEVDEGKDYIVESILAEDQDVDGKLFYLLKWEGYPFLKSTWEPAENIKGRAIFDEWEAQKERIVKGYAKEFDIEKFYQDLDLENEAKALRHGRRIRKRKQLGLPSSTSASKTIDAGPTPEQSDSDLSSEAQEVDEVHHDSSGIRARPRELAQKLATRRATCSDHGVADKESPGTGKITKPRPRLRYNIPDDSDQLSDDSVFEEFEKPLKGRTGLDRSKPTTCKSPDKVCSLRTT